ncbi:MAG: molybdopterin molybdenumtransferase MoeA, partial [Tissierellia bacterium]|nr:molybdopterin molybdenumtransferase MoeA [Tissierellia bacterium]
MEFFNVVSIRDAGSKILDNFKDYNFEVEEVSILEATDRILAVDIVSDINVPEF